MVKVKKRQRLTVRQSGCTDKGINGTCIVSLGNSFQTQGKLALKLTLGPFLTLSVRNGPDLQSYLFQEYISLNPSRVKQIYTIHLLKWLKLTIETRNAHCKLIIWNEN